MLKKAFVMAVLTLVVVATASLLVHSSFGQNKNDTLPPGSWMVSAQPYLGTAYESQPVKVIGVVSDASHGFKVTSVGLKNTSSKVVSAVKLRWYITSEESRELVLLQGDTNSVRLGKGLPVGKSEYFETPIVSFGKVSKQLLRAGSLKGIFTIEVAVSQILYEDGSTWEGDPKKTVTFVKAGLRPGPLPPQGCANQVCQYNVDLGAYQCVGGLNQICMNCGRLCINAVCGEPLPMCGPPRPN